MVYRNILGQVGFALAQPSLCQPGGCPVACASALPAPQGCTGEGMGWLCPHPSCHGLPRDPAWSPRLSLQSLTPPTAALPPHCACSMKSRNWGTGTVRILKAFTQFLIRRKPKFHSSNVLTQSKPTDDMKMYFVITVPSYIAQTILISPKL